MSKFVHPNITKLRKEKEKKPIYMAGASVGDLEIKYVTDALKNGWYHDKYYYVERLEKSFARYHNRKYALMTPNCTSAIHLLLAGLGIGPGDEVIVPECTWIATTVSSVHLGAKVIFCDIEKDSWCLDPESSYITDTTPEKQGKLSPGMHIPVMSPEQGFNETVDYAYLGAWNFIQEIKNKEIDFVAGGGKFISHVPLVKFV